IYDQVARLEQHAGLPLSTYRCTLIAWPNRHATINRSAITKRGFTIKPPSMKPMFEHIALPESSSINAFIQKKEEFDYPFHYHAEYELTYILSSRGIRYTGNHFEDFGDNDLVLLGPNL